ncbi:DNA-binding NarL/FixJ family response regulator [Diaminobutyricimonas aerilata]|uniref:DNA-binding NarL/FixJ family response regulator n=1 Tax=Diaminobutyricimonas aerilata TaxID=1162967 RepID=A0A2M9CFD1_9MICO|nr:response regulator transcription factor [Diaminobutyricimonas aerilata]PJJ70560.1 DNA-binding NarL/FixJ family response regulator [Diaminobutyricimonas aerilata]
MIRVMVADDQKIVRSGIAVVVGAADDIEVVGEAKDGYEAVEFARELRPDVVLMDIRMPGRDGIEATRLLSADPDGAIPVLVLTTFDLDDYVFGALEAGAAGFLLKGADEETLIAAIRSVASGSGTLDQRLTRRVIAEFAARRPTPQKRRDELASALTGRELEILELLCEGLSNQEMATRLFIEPSTVKYHVAGLLAKIGARDRLQAVVWAFQNGVVAPSIE